MSSKNNNTKSQEEDDEIDEESRALLVDPYKKRTVQRESSDVGTKQNYLPKTTLEDLGLVKPKDEG
jgi:hypothetical protein